jgi:hypothetical protein
MKTMIHSLYLMTCLFLACLIVFTEGCKKDEEATEYSLNINILPAGSGTVNLSPSGGTYEEGTEVTLTANPGADYTFGSWSGTDSSYVNNNKIVMNKNMDVTANFKQKTMIRMQSGVNLVAGAHIFFVALSKDVNYFDLPTDSLFAYRKTEADWYIDGDMIPFTTDYKEFLLNTGEYYFLLSGSGTVMVTTITVINGKQTFLVYGIQWGGLMVDVVVDGKSAPFIEEGSRRAITYKR